MTEKSNVGETRVVPVEPTEEMLSAALRAVPKLCILDAISVSDIADCYRAMLSCAPQPNVSLKPGEWVCENHPDQRAHDCPHCKGAGMPPSCLPAKTETPSDLIERIEAHLSDFPNNDTIRKYAIELRAYALAQKERADKLNTALSHAQEWARNIAHDERVCGWVHQEDYGLYCLLADCPVDFDVLGKVDY